MKRHKDALKPGLLHDRMQRGKKEIHYCGGYKALPELEDNGAVWRDYKVKYFQWLQAQGVS